MLWLLCCFVVILQLTSSLYFCRSSLRSLSCYLIFCLIDKLISESLMTKGQMLQHLVVFLLVSMFFTCGHGRNGSSTVIDYSENKVSVKCDLCSDQWLFIISTGRSGSTSIMTMLNLIPGTCYSQVASTSNQP